MKRRGFTLIELMVVIAIIIILAAIAIPNYLSMTARAKKSRVASDFAAVATALETFRTDWGVYPSSAGASPAFEALTTDTTQIYWELANNTTDNNTTPKINKTGGSLGSTTAAGDVAPITYMTKNILGSMKNPYSSAVEDAYKYEGDGVNWVLYAPTVAGANAPTDTTLLSRSDLTTTITGPSVALTLGN